MFLNVDFFYFGDVHEVNGINFVTNLFLKGKEIFKDNNILLHNIYSNSGIIDCEKISHIEIGKNSNVFTHKWYMKFRRLLSIILSSNIKCFSWLKVKLSMIVPAKKVIDRYSANLNSDVIIFQDIFTAYYYFKKENKRRIKTILILHCEKDPYEQLLTYYPSLKVSKYLDKLIEIKKNVYDNIDKIVFLSKKAYQNNMDVEYKSTYIYNGIQDVLNHSFEMHPNVNIVCVGSTTGHKGQEILIEAMSQLKSEFSSESLKLHLIGGGPQLNFLKTLSNKLGLKDKVIFYGERNDVDELLKKMDIMILPSKSEGMPLAILEGMRQGMYILATNVGAIPEMINSNFGNFVNRDPKDIANKIKFSILNNKTSLKTKQLSRNHYLENFTLQKMILNYSMLIKNI